MKTGRNLTERMLVALVLGLLFGLGMIILRERLIAVGNADTWNSINAILFADITQAGNEHALGIFYIVGQLFVRALQLVIVPMVFTSIVLAMIRISDANKLGRISRKTISVFFVTTIISIIVASIIGYIAYKANLFHNDATGLEATTGTSGANPLLILINAVPSNFVSALSNNSGVLAVVVSAVAVGLSVNKMKDSITALPKLCQEVSDIITVVLSFVINAAGPFAIFCLLSRTCASYGIAYLKPALAYVLITVALLLLMLFVGYPLVVRTGAGLEGFLFFKKIAKVALFGFSTSSSAATLPLNQRTTIGELGVNEEVASFVLPLGMTVNMDGTAIMQVLATLFIAGCSGYDVSFANIIVIGVLAIVASIGTPAAPGAGAVILFTILTGMGYNNEMALMTYTLILAINRPIEMLVTSLNVVGDSACAVVVAKSEGCLDEGKFYAER